MKRFWEIDLLRALAIIGMIVFHFFFILDFYDVFNQDLSEGLWHILARIVQFIFIGLVGVSLALSRQKGGNFYKKQIKRGLTVLGAGLLVSAGTWFVVEEFVRFGILHFIGAGILIGQFFAGFRFGNLILAGVSFFAGQYVEGISTEFPPLYIFGFDYGSINTIDYFPIFPWISMVFLGIFLGNIFYKNGERKFAIKDLRMPKFVSFLSKHSLIIYLLHVPIIVALIFLLQSILTV